MLYEPTNTPAMARTSNLNEELGQVNTVVSIQLYILLTPPIYQTVCTCEVSVNLSFSTHTGEVHLL